MKLSSWVCVGVLLTACNNGGTPADGGGDTTPPSDAAVDGGSARDTGSADVPVMGDTPLPDVFVADVPLADDGSPVDAGLADVPMMADMPSPDVAVADVPAVDGGAPLDTGVSDVPVMMDTPLPDVVVADVPVVDGGSPLDTGVSDVPVMMDSASLDVVADVPVADGGSSMDTGSADAPTSGDSSPPADVVPWDAGPSILVRTATPCGGPLTTPAPTLPTGVTWVADLGLTGPPDTHRHAGRQILTRRFGRWQLWNGATGALVTSGIQDCSVNCAEAEMAGFTIVLQSATNFEIRSAVDGHLVTTLTSSAPILLATDGSYLYSATSTGLTVWTPTGTVLFSRAVNYLGAVIFAAPGELRVAGLPAGAGIEHIAVPTGVSTMTTGLSGSSPQWFADGSHVATFAAVDRSAGWIYAADGTLSEFTNFPGTFTAGMGNFWWSASALYQVGHSSAPYPGFSTVAVDGADGILLEYRDGSAAGITLHVVQVTPTGFTHLSDTLLPPTFDPSGHALQFAGDVWGHWSIAKIDGQLFDEGSLALSLTCGSVTYYQDPSDSVPGRQVLAASGSGMVAVSTVSGRVVIIDTSTSPATVLGYMPINGVHGLAWSGDGSVLLVSTGTSLLNTLTAYAMPGGGQISVPYTSGRNPELLYALSEHGGQIVLTNASPGMGRQVIDLYGHVLLGAVEPNPSSSSPYYDYAPALSADGTYAAFGPLSPALYNGSTLTGTPAFRVIPVGWVDDGHFVAWVQSSSYTSLGLGTFDNTGAVVSLLSTIDPAFRGTMLLSGDRIFGPYTDSHSNSVNAIFRRTTGAYVWQTQVCSQSIPVASNGYAVCSDFDGIAAEALPL